MHSYNLLVISFIPLLLCPTLGHRNDIDCEKCVLQNWLSPTHLWGPFLLHPALGHIVLYVNVSFADPPGGVGVNQCN